MWLLAGLGNDGKKYVNNRHNIGFKAVEAIAQRYHFPTFKENSEKFSLRSEGNIADQRVLLFKAKCLMNASGVPIGRCKTYSNIASDHLIVIHDELDLPVGKVRAKFGGGSGGHNGLRSVDNQIGQEYWRIRIGIDHPRSNEAYNFPDYANMVSDYVLHDFNKEERSVIDSTIAAISEHIGLLMVGNDAEFMNKVTLTVREKK